MDDALTWGDLIAALQEVASGDRKLDALVAYHCGAVGRDTHQMVRLLIDEGSSWDLVFELMEGEIPAFTTSLDAAVPGENIVCAIFSTKYQRWAAVHRGEDGAEILAWAANEVLARRVAGLRATREQAEAAKQRPELPGPEARPQPTAPRRSDFHLPELGAADEEEWKILF
ncbi:MAG: hypothetical protein QNJ30_18185 [Kiloniellales bacterium]|nr:hypothetical protein [Kiloniellales bacterium]